MIFISKYSDTPHPNSGKVEILDWEKELGVELVVQEREPGPTVVLDRYCAYFPMTMLVLIDRMITISGDADHPDLAIWELCKKLSHQRVSVISETGDERIVQVPSLTHTRVKKLAH